MKKTLSYIAGALMLLIPSVSGGQALPFTAVDSNPVTLAKGTAGLVETSSISRSAFTNSAAVPFSDLKFDVSAGYMMWQPASINSNVISIGAAYNMNSKFGIAAGLYYGMNPEYGITDANGSAGGTFKPSDIHAAVGVSYRFIDALSVGVNLGYATSSLAEGQSYGTIAADAFLMAKFSDFKVAAGVSNFLGGIKSESGAKFSIPASAAVGAGYGKTFAEKHAVEANLDLDYFFSGGLAAAVGAGYTFNDFVSVRAGYRYGGASPIPSFASVGAGVKFAGVKLDLAYIIAGADSPAKNTLAVAVGYCF